MKRYIDKLQKEIDECENELVKQHLILFKTENYISEIELCLQSKRTGLIKLEEICQNNQK